MPRPSKPRRPEPSIFALWFHLTEKERWYVAGILLIALIGLSARYVHLKSLEPEKVGAEETPAEMNAREVW